jgi:hypothetical protein
MTATEMILPVVWTRRRVFNGALRRPAAPNLTGKIDALSRDEPRLSSRAHDDGRDCSARRRWLSPAGIIARYLAMQQARQS